MSIPQHLIVTTSKIRQMPLGKLIHQLLWESAADDVKEQAKTSEQQSLTASALFITWLVYGRWGRKLAGWTETEQLWSLYMDVLPDSFDSMPIWWLESVVNGTNSPDARVLWGLLRGTELAKQLPAYRNLEKEQYQKVFCALSEADPVRFPASVFTWRRWLWGWCVIKSRTFPARLAQEDDADLQFSCLIPLMDFANHRPGTRVTWEHGANGVRWITDQAFAQGSGVSNNYGPKGNFELLKNYGFVLGANPYDAVEVKMAAATASLSPLKHAILAALDLPLTHRYFLRRQVSRGPPCIPPSLLIVIRLLLLADAELAEIPGVRSLLQPHKQMHDGATTEVSGTVDQVQKRVRAHSAVDEAAKWFVGHEHEYHALDRLHFLLRARLQRIGYAPEVHPNDSHHNGVDASATQQTYHRFLCTEYVSGERAVLQDSLEHLTKIWNQAALAALKDHPPPASAPCAENLVLSKLWHVWAEGGCCHVVLQSSSPSVPIQEQSLHAVLGKPLMAGEVAIAVPISRVLCVASARRWNSSFAEVLDSAVSGIDEFLCLQLHLIHMLTTGDHTPEQAPTRRLLKITWADAESSLANQADKEPAAFEAFRSAMRESFQEVFPALSNAYPEVFPQARFTLQRFLVSGAVVDRCALNSDHKLFVVPGFGSVFRTHSHAATHWNIQQWAASGASVLSSSASSTSSTPSTPTASTPSTPSTPSKPSMPSVPSMPSSLEGVSREPKPCLVLRVLVDHQVGQELFVKPMY